ncbi:hypothetical protein [Citrobacter freundii]|uniref:hypothetical protein n=1 Tax=Citrobacter freundii TaxID=546 RepID=UPI003F9AF9E7
MKPSYEELEARCAELAAENAGLKDFVKTCFRAAADGASLDGADIQELGERLGLFGRETYQPALHGYICGHEAGEDTVCVMKKTPATDAFLAEVRANVIKEALKSLDGFLTLTVLWSRTASVMKTQSSAQQELTQFQRLSKSSPPSFAKECSHEHFN